MKNPNIARILRHYRKLNNLSINEVSEYLDKKDLYAAPKTIYAWENGTTQPSADTLMELCSYYHIDNILETFGYGIVVEHQSLPIHLSEDEKLLIEAYRNKPSMQAAVKKLLEID